MKIEKIKNYNQKLLAIIGTIAVLLAIVALISFIAFAINEFFRNSNYEQESGILSNEKIEELQEENKREQVISYKTPKLIDTLNQVYIIPVSHKSLNEPEEIDKSLLGIMDTSSRGFEYKTDQRYSSHYYGDFNNVLVYDQKTENVVKLFNKRVNFDEIKAEYFDDDILLLFKVAEKDTHKDGVINLLDFKSLYIYSLNKKKLVKIGIDEMDVYTYKFLNNSKNLVVRFGIDKNTDGKYEEYNEPTLIKKYNYQTGKLTDIVAPSINSELQKTLEGSNI